MDHMIRRRKIERLKAQLEACRLQDIAFAQEYEASSAPVEKEEIARRWDKVTQEKRSVQSALDLLEKQAKDSAALN